MVLFIGVIFMIIICDLSSGDTDQNRWNHLLQALEKLRVVKLRISSWSSR